MFGKPVAKIEPRPTGRIDQPLAPLPPDYIPPKHRQRSYSEAAAKAAEQTEELLAQLDRAHAELGTLRAHCQVIEEHTKILQEERDQLVLANERLTRENTTIQTRVAVAAETLIALRGPVPVDEKAAQEAVAKAIEGVP